MAKSPLSSPHKFAPRPSNVTEFLPTGSNWSGYWLFVSGSVLIMLLVYLAANGQLTNWLALFSFNIPSTVTAGSANSASTANEVAGSGTNMTGTAVSAAGAVASPFMPGLGALTTVLQNMFGGH